MRTSSNGFSLIELLIVVAILGVLASIAVPLFSDYRAKAKDASAHSDAKNMLSIVTAAQK